MKAHHVPDAALAETIAIVGKTGSGKSYTARGLVERVLDAGRRVCILDPTGVWWGLRLGERKDSGYPVVRFGGEHADLPLTEGNAGAVARLIADGQFSAVVDLADMTMGSRTRIATAFADELYKANRQPLTLVADEADLFAPQRAMPDQTIMLSRFEQIARRGRVRGFRLWVITQRPAELHKSVLSQAATLVAMKLTAPQDRDAIGAWIEGQADRVQGKAILATLPRMKVGEGYVWSPEHDILERGVFPAIRTLDTMQAPELGDPLKSGYTVSVVDIGALQKALGDSEKDIADNDPKALRARIAELERRPREPAIDGAALSREYLRGVRAGFVECTGKFRQRVFAMDAALQSVRSTLDDLRASVESDYAEIVNTEGTAHENGQSSPFSWNGSTPSHGPREAETKLPVGRPLSPRRTTAPRNAT